MIEMCQKFFDLLNKKLELLPKVFYGVMYTLKNHFKSTWKDAIICIYFLRVMYPAFLTYETYFIEADKDSKQGFLILIIFFNIFTIFTIFNIFTIFIFIFFIFIFIYCSESQKIEKE